MKILALLSLSAVPPDFASFLIFSMPTQAAVNDIKSRSEEPGHCLKVSISEESVSWRCDRVPLFIWLNCQFMNQISLRFVQSAQTADTRGTQLPFQTVSSHFKVVL